MAPNKVARTVCLGIIISMLLISNCSRDPDEADVINISNTPRRSEHPAIAADSRGYFYVVWDDNLMGVHQKVYLVSQSLNGEWSKPVEPFYDEVAQWPDIAVDNSDNIHLAWQIGIEGWMEILYSKKSAGSD